VILQRLSGVTSSLLNFPKKIKHGSQIRYAIPTIPQAQAAVKLHGVFSPQWKMMDCSSTLCGFTGL
jgi:hypothetical protein